MLGEPTPPEALNKPLQLFPWTLVPLSEPGALPKIPTLWLKGYIDMMVLLV